MSALLFLAHRIPYPPDKGDKIRSFHLLRHLARRHEVHLGAFIDDRRDWAHVAELKRICKDACFVALPPMRARLHSLAALATGEPLTLRYFHSKRLGRWVDGLLRAGRISRALAFSSAMAQYLPEAVPGVRRVLDFVDLDSDKWRQYGEQSRGPRRWLYRREARTLFAEERRYAASFDASLFVSEAEAGLFAAAAPEVAGRVAVVENGVDAAYFSPQATYVNPYGQNEAAVVFTGAMDYWANVDAVTWFARDVFPVVRAARPDASFYIVGTRPSREVRELAGLPGVCVTGAVPDTRPYLAHARAAVAPLRLARGVQNKVLEAMAMACPVVASPQAIAAIRPCAELSEWSGGTPERIAGLLLRLLHGQEAVGLGQALRAHVQRHYDWQRNLERLDAIVDGEATTTGQRS